MMAKGAYAAAGKRPLDMAGALVLLALLLAPMAMVAGLVRWRLAAPVLFRQTRAGLGGTPSPC
jgi:lipopolysaccharide/colanic/teichoic acid biosynthesis glycosyltransferase